MKKAWTILLISAITDFIIVAGTAWTVLAQGTETITRQQVITVIIGGFIAFARTIQQALKSTPETSAALSGSVSTVSTSTIEKTP